MDVELRPQFPIGRRADNIQSETPNSTQSVDDTTATDAQHLPPVDEGWRAWTYCTSGFMLGTLLWGFVTRRVHRCRTQLYFGHEAHL